MRSPVKTENYRAGDLVAGDVVKLRIHNKDQWVLLTEDAAADGELIVNLTYAAFFGPSQFIQVPRYQLVPVQILKDA